MSRNSKKKTDADKLGEQRMEKFEERRKLPDVPIIKESEDLEEYTVTTYQKIEPGEWQRVELTYKRKKQ
jgi:hypothetical protein